MGVTLSTRGRRRGGGTEREWRACERRKPEARLRPADGVGKCGVCMLFRWHLYFTVSPPSLCSAVPCHTTWRPSKSQRRCLCAAKGHGPERASRQLSSHVLLPRPVVPPPARVRLRLRGADGGVDGGGGGGDGSGEVGLPPRTTADPSVRVANSAATSCSPALLYLLPLRVRLRLRGAVGGVDGGGGGGDGSGEVRLPPPPAPSAATPGRRARRRQWRLRNRGPSAGGHDVGGNDSGGTRWERRCCRCPRPGGVGVHDVDAAGSSGHNGGADHSGAATTVERPGREAQDSVAAGHTATGGCAAADWAGVAEKPDGADGVETIAGRAAAPQPDS